MNVDLNYYKTFIFDFDGVILDSNNIKKNAIKKAVQGILSSRKANEFVNYFVSLNGVPREIKIAKFIPEDKYQFVLNKYELIINKKLKNAELIPGVFDLIKKLSKMKKTMMVLSGGTRSEVEELLIHNKIAKNFHYIFGGPKSKTENLRNVSLKYPVLYFGDSETDYLVSRDNNFDFIFVYGASNIENWENRAKQWRLVDSIKNFIFEV